MNPLPCRWAQARRLVLLSALLAASAAFFPGQPLRAGDVAPATVAALDYQDTAYAFGNWYVPQTTQSAHFQREPAVSGRVYRGTLNFGGSASNSFSFFWQRDARKLFLDLNHNRDLTDDTNGVFTARGDSLANYNTFTNVHLVLTTASGRCPVCADLNFWDYGAQMNCSVSLHSLWQAKVTLAGADWQVGVIPNLLKPADDCAVSQLLLRPWARRGQPIEIAASSFDVVPFTQKIFLDGHAWQISPRANPQNGEFKPALQFAEQPVTLGELKITGKYIQRLRLAGASYLVICDQPGDTLKVPVGNYSPPDVLLEQGGVKAFSSLVGWQQPNRISVAEKTPAVLVAGGPLTNSVLATRHGQDLRLDYRLLGAGGMTYQLANQNRSHPPEFAIYKGERQIASGSFEFG